MTVGSVEPGDGAEPSSTRGSSWFVRVWADPAYHQLVASRDADAAVAFPGDEVVPREVSLRGDEVRIGRGGDARQSPEDVPEVDLSGPPRDPGVSHLHAVLLALPDDRWVVLDPGSTNGVTVNYAEEALRPNSPVPIRAGDRIHLGAWTTLTVERR